MTNNPPSTLTQPPPPPAAPPKSNLPMFYYGLVVVGIAAIVLAVYNLIIIRWCTNHHRRSRRQRMSQTLHPTTISSRSFDSNPNINLISSFKYKKEGVSHQDKEEQEEEEEQSGYYGNNECSVCLSVFEGGEQVRQLPTCKHSFHASCIDMWLYSHFDCPLCRSPVDLPVLHGHTPESLTYT